MDTLEWLQKWYLSQCDGDWEHSFGVHIETLDNPGWRFSVDLENTDLEGKSFEEVTINRTEHDWLRCWISESTFEGACGSENLYEVLNVFRQWADSVEPA